MNWQRFSLRKQDCTPFSIKNGADPAPPWRQFMGLEEFKKHHKSLAQARWQELQKLRNARARQKADSFFLPDNASCQKLVLAVNAALQLRRPLLISGLPGSGKTSLAFVIADWLGLGPVLEWPVSPGAQLADALATYNPLARLQDLEQDAMAQRAGSESRGDNRTASDRPVTDYIRLGPVGTAFLPAALPRVLLIDEIDKGDLNLANDLLHLFEEGKFPIPELQRAERHRKARRRSDQAEDEPHDSQISEVETWDEAGDGTPLTAPIRGGHVQCHQFPLVLMTSNGDREFPPAFNRRCLRVRMPDFGKDQTTLQEIINVQLKKNPRTERGVELALMAFQQAAADNRGELATDQLLNLAYLMDHQLDEAVRQRLNAVLLQGLSSEPGSDESDDDPFGDDLFDVEDDRDPEASDAGDQDH
jgi:MoxR-like ATPase